MTVKMRRLRRCWTAWPQKQNKKSEREPSGVAGGLIVIPETEYYGK